MSKVYGALIAVFSALLPACGGGSAAVDGVAVDGVPADGVPADGVPADGVPADGVRAEAPPLEPGLITSSDGVALEVQLLAQGDDGLPVILVPGMIVGADHWRQRPALLAALGARQVVAISLRGRGRSAVPDQGWTAGHHQADIGAVVGALGFSRYHLVAHSMGAAYALGYALDHPAEVASLTVGDYFPAVVRVTPEWVAAIVEGGRIDPRVPRGVLAEQGPAHSAAAVEVMPGQVERFEVDHRPRLPGFDRPLLAIMGARGMPPVAAAMYASAPQAEVVRIDAGHAVFTHADAVAAVAAFVRRHDGPTRPDADAP